MSLSVFACPKKNNEKETESKRLTMTEVLGVYIPYSIRVFRVYQCLSVVKICFMFSVHFTFLLCYPTIRKVKTIPVE